MVVNKNKRGRPAHIPTPKARLTVRVMKCDGRTQEEIASVLGISLNTLQRKYAEELATGNITLRAEIMQKMATLAKKGNISAARLFITQTEGWNDRVATAAAEAEFMAEIEKPKVKPLGKKEQAIEDAKTAGLGSEWGDLLDPNAIPIGIIPN